MEGLENQLRIAGEAAAMLEKENDSLRSLAQGGGEVSVPAELIAKVEADYGLKFLSNPVFHKVAAEELGYRVEAAMESRMGPQGMDDREEAYKRIGWLKGEERLLHLLVAVKSVGALGWFDEGTGEAWVTDKFDVKNVPDQAAMVRLLVRVLLHQNFPSPAAYPGDDAARAREALHAGAASGAEARFYAINAKAIGFVPMKENGAATRLLLALPELIQGLTVFPGLEGRGLADTLFVKGTEEFAEGMRKPPANTLEVVFSGEIGRGGKVDHGEISDEIYLEESAGYLGLRLWIAETGDVGIAEQVAREWMRDGYVLFADGESSTGLFWDVEFEGKEGADLFEGVALDRVAATVRKEDGVKAGEVVETEEGRFLTVKRTGETTVRFVNAAVKETAAKPFGK